MTKARALPPVAWLREKFWYDPSVGELRWLTSGRHRVKDAIAGTINEGGYRQIGVSYEGKVRFLLAHRVIYKLITGEEPGLIDHRRGVDAGNFFENLRPADRKLNRWNSRKMGGRELPKHVYRARSKFAASVCFDGRRYHRCGFLTAEAAEAYALDLTRKFHGEFAASEGVAVV